MKACSACDEESPTGNSRGGPKQGRLWLLGWLFTAILLSACGGPEVDRRQGPIIWITASAMRPDVVGSLGGESGWTPRLDEFAGSATWKGRAIAASSSPLPALATLLTGVDPWQHGILSHLDKKLRPDVPTVAARLGQLGYTSTAVFPRFQQFRETGIFAGFDEILDLDLASSSARLSSLTGEADLIWLHLAETSLPFRDRRAEVPLLSTRPAPAAASVGQHQLAPFIDPSRPLPTGLGAVAWELYRHEVAAADHAIGVLLDGLKASGQWDSSWIIVTSLLGTELGEHQQALHGQNLGRKSIEVPLLMKQPLLKQPGSIQTGSIQQGQDMSIAATSPVAAGRLAATMIEAAGGAAPPALLPSLTTSIAEPVILSSLYMRNGLNHFSLMLPETGEQLHWRARFADAEPEFFLAQQVQRGKVRRTRESPKRIFQRLRRQFRSQLPLTGDSSRPVDLRLEHWLSDGSVEAIEDPARSEQLAGQLRYRWARFAGSERSLGSIAAVERERP